MEENKEITENNLESEEIVDDIVYDESESVQDIVKKLKLKIKELEKEKEEYLNSWQRERADFVNFKKEEDVRADHIRRVLTTFPGVFSGIGEFSIHKEFVSSKVAGEVATINNKALDRILDFAGEVGLPAILHCDVNVPFPKPNQDPYIVKMLGELFARHPKTTIIWAHVGLGRVVRPVADQAAMVERAINNPALNHVYFDLSWDETAKYIVGSTATVAKVAGLINRHPDRFLYGSDEVAPTEQSAYLKTYTMYAPLLAQLTPEARAMFLKGNYERIFDAARKRVRAWEKANVGKPKTVPPKTPISGYSTNR